MRIAMIGLYPRDPSQICGGVEAVTLRLANGLTSIQDVELHIIVSTLSWEKGTFRQSDNRIVHSVGGARRFGNILQGIPQRRRIGRVLRKINPDVVHAHSADRFALAAIDSGYPAVVTIHGIIEAETSLEKDPIEKVRGFFRNRMGRIAIARARNIILLSPFVLDHYGSALAHARTRVVENPVDPLFFKSGENEDPDTVLFAGLIIPRKGLRNLLDALHIVRKEIPGVRLRLAGLATDPDYRKELDRKVETLKLQECVAFLGGLSPNQLAAEYSGAALTVLVSRQDTSPVSILEAMAAGRPIVASDVGGIPDLVREGETGFLVPYGDPGLLARRMVALLKDRDLRVRMGAAARLEAERRFSVESVSRQTLDVYREVIGG